jgi:glycosyltransferase involved in cell wall biosynthesis
MVSWREGDPAVRILKVVQAYYPFQEHGGPVVKVRALARGLVQRGHQVTVLTADLGLGKRGGQGMKFERCRWGWRSEQDGVEAIYLSTFGHYRALTINPRVIGFCRASLMGFDLVHFYGLYDLLGPAVSSSSTRLDIPYVIEPMGMFRPIVRNIWLKRVYHRLLGRSFIGGARLLIATSDQERQELIDGEIPASRIAVRRNGVDVPESLPERGEFRRKWGIRADARVVLFLGRLVSKKSPDLLIEAFAGWRDKSGRGMDSVLVLAGPEQGDGFVPRLKKMANQLGLGESVRFVGPLYDEGKWQAYRDADVFVLPSLNENFGNTAAESAACGTPVIVTDRCGIASFVGHAGLVVSHDRGQVELALGRLLDDPSLRQRYREGCAEMARALSWAGPIGENEKLYEQCLVGMTAQ